MRKLLALIMMSIIMTVSACGTPAEKVKYSENILVSIDYGGVGFGTRADCTDANVYFHTDKTVRIFMPDTDYKNYVEIGRFELSEEDYEKIKELSEPEKITKLTIKEKDACDGTSSYIMLYGENDEEIYRIGGYMPDGEDFHETRSALIEIAHKYGLREIVEEHRATLQ